MIRPAICAALLIALPAQAFDLQGHRGARGLLPENTLPAFQKALDLGVDTIECDMAVTRDGVVVVYHDQWLNPDITRGPDGKWLDRRGPAIIDLTYAQLQQYDVGRIRPGTKYANDFPAQQPVDGTRIPRLSDLFDLVKKSGNTKIGFDCETKISPLELAEARALGIAVIPWTVNNPAMMNKLLDMGVDGIISDRPDLVQAELRKRK